MVSFRPTTAQAFGRGVFLGALTGCGFAAVLTTLWAVGLLRVAGMPVVVGILVPLMTGVLGGAAVGLVFGRAEGTDIDDSGIHPVPALVADRYAPWHRIADLRTERRRGCTRVAVFLDNGQIVRLTAPYHGRLLAGDPEFERKVFMMRHLWETHRNFTVKPFPASN